MIAMPQLLKPKRLAVAALVLSCSFAAAHETGAPHGQGAPASGMAMALPATEVPLFDTLGNHSYRVSTEVALAQPYFNQGLRWMWAFNHGEALRAFKAAQAADPSCAMCYWGEALVLGPNINMGMDPKAVAPALAALAQARALSGQASERERRMIGALSVRYAEGEATRGEAYAEAMSALAARFPQDDEIATLTADALMNLSPWDYWLDGGATPKPATTKILSALETVLARNPNHPGVIHLYIHTVEASTTPLRAEPHADRLAALMPGAGHIVHMPAHIYHRVGRWIDSLETNRKAVAADEAYFRRAGIAPAEVPGAYTDGYYPHNLHFLMTSAQMAGDVEAIAEATQKLQALVSNASAKAVPWLQAIKAGAYFAHAQYDDPEKILLLAAPRDALPYVQAARHYARGIAFARRKSADHAEAEAAAIRRIAIRTDFSVEEAGGLPARPLLELAALIVEGRIAQAAGDFDEAKRRLEAAAVIEDGFAYMEPSHWYYSVRQTLGAVHLQRGDAGAAEAAFTHALKQTPNNAWALWGLWQVHLMQGNTEKAGETRHRFEAAWAGEADFLS